MIKVNLGILNLLDWLVGGEGGERGDLGRHLGLYHLDTTEVILLHLTEFLIFEYP